MKARNRLAGLVLFVASSVVVSGCSLDDILAVRVPGKVLEEDLNSASLANVLATGVIAEVECSWNQYVAGSAHHSDEYVPTSGNLTMRNWGQRKIYASDAGYAQGTCGGWGYPMFTPLHTARFQAEDVSRRLEGFGGEVANAAALQASVAVWGAFPLVAMGEGFCRMAIDGGAAMQPGEVQTLAEQRFSSAISLAQGTGDATLTMQGTLGRARVRLAMGNYAGAMADASQIPDGFVVNVSRDASESRRYNYYFERLNAPTGFRAHGSVADNYQNLTIGADGMPMDGGDGVKDTRVNVKTDGTQAADFATILYYHDKYNSRGDPLPLVHWHEARMFEAEAMAMQGDVAGALGKINGLRMAAGLPEVTADVGAGQIMDLVKEERRRQLFVLGGHRLHDMLRFDIPFLGEPGSIHPNGLDQTGAEYGNLTCFQLPEVEVKGNENISS